MNKRGSIYRLEGEWDMKNYLVLGVILFFVIGYGTQNIQGASQTTQQKIYIPIIAKGLQANFWNQVKLGAERAAKEYDVQITFEGPEKEGAVEEQLSMLQEALIRQPQAIILSAVDSAALTPYLEEAQQAGIPVIGFDSGVDSPIVRTTVATDNYGTGALAADKMAELLDGKGEVGIIVQDNTSKVATDRRDGFIDTIEQRYPDMKVVAIEYGGGEVSRSAELTKRILAEHPNIKGIFGGNEGSAYGVINAVRELNKAGEIIVIGFDSGKILTDAIKEGIVAGAVTQRPIEIGYEAVEAAVRAYEGQELPAFIDTGFVWYDQFNIDSPEIRELLYE
jgi:ribose transport system substrate-binding protein